ncbi:MAG: aldose 1-epimerase family protein [Armatimonadetes bacterium]|nr:aldose 1-epimerase family protein [Candidatus Hippobium faecium]
MAFYQGINYTKEELLKRVGSVHAVAGIKKLQYTEGFSKGYEAVEFRTGTGLRFVVALDRCMDVVQADFCGKTLNWKCSAEECSPAFYEEQGINWLYTFAGGLTATCGLMNVGNPNNFDGDPKGQHGRVGNIPAYNVSLTEEWQGDDFVMIVKGSMRETRLFGCNYVLERTVSAKLGENKIYIEDNITNEAHIKWPLEVLYHMNCGFPLVDEGSYLVVPSAKTEPRDEAAAKDIDTWDRLIAPVNNYAEECFFHDVKTEKGFAKVAIINPRIDLGMCIKYSKDSLPYFTEWKCMDEGQYALGFEPANCHVMGMEWEAENGTLEYMEPGQTKKNIIEITVLDGKEEIENCEKELRKF